MSRRCAEGPLWSIKLPSPRIGGPPPSQEGGHRGGGSICKMRAKKTSRFRIMSYTPLEKPPQISPIFKADKVTPHISREKDGKLRLAYAGWDDTRSFRRTAAGKLAG